ncbi:uncharacterized protein prr18 [Pholidichthys leucotaenia]
MRGNTGSGSPFEDVVGNYEMTSSFSWLCLVRVLATPSCLLRHKAAGDALVRQWNSGRRAEQVHCRPPPPPPSTSVPANARRAPGVAWLRAPLFARFCILITSSRTEMPFPPISSFQQRISSPGRELFGKKKAPPQTEQTGKSQKGGSDKEKQPSSWASANLRNLGRKPQQDKSKSPTQKPSVGQETQGKGSWLMPPRPQESSEAVRRSSSMDSARQLQGKDDGKKEIQFTLSLTPEAILVIQKRNLEKQMMAKQQKCCAATDFRHRRVFPSKKALGGSKGCAQPAAKGESPEQDITAIVKISLLNDQYKYDDVEYEDEDGDVDETVVRKCKEWLKGVENAAALGKVDKLPALPHLKGC